MEKTERVIIIGSGPAGYTAAIYAARANLKPLMIEGTQSGGQLMITSEVENYPGFAKGIMGPELMQQFREQAERFGTRFVQQTVTSVNFQKEPYFVASSEGRFYGEAIILATGASSKWLDLPSEQRLIGKGVSSCATCDGAFFKGLAVTVIGGGDSALEEALFLTKFASQVTLIHRRDQLRASKIMQDRARKNPKIQFIWNTTVLEVLGQDGVDGLRLQNLVTQEESQLPCAGAFIAIGHTPNTAFLAGQVDLDSKGYILMPHRPTTRTSRGGVFAAGDVQDVFYRQAITAAGSGCQAAIDAERYLEARE